MILRVQSDHNRLMQGLLGNTPCVPLKNTVFVSLIQHICSFYLKRVRRSMLCCSPSLDGILKCFFLQLSGLFSSRLLAKVETWSLKHCRKEGRFVAVLKLLCMRNPGSYLRGDCLAQLLGLD